MKKLMGLSPTRSVSAPYANSFVASHGYALLTVLLIAAGGLPSLTIAEDLNADLEAALEVIFSAPPVPTAQLPEGGAFYSVQRPDVPPLPVNLYGLPAWELGEGIFLVDDADIIYGLPAQAIAAPGIPSGGTPMSSQPHTSNDLWLAINAVTSGDTSWTADLTIHTPVGDTNSSYDVFWAPALDSPTDWQFLMRCPTNFIAQTNVFARYLCEELGFFGLEGVLTNCDLVVSTNVTAQEMAELLMPPWVTITNATYTGAVVARGEFSNGNCAGLPVDSGVILASGYITNAVGPNDDHGAETASVVFGASDADLDLLVGGQGSDDAAVLEFDVLSTNSCTLRFRYVYASEEYPEYSGEDYNDPMGIFVSTNHVGGQWVIYTTNNIALIPGVTNVPVTVNTVRGGWDDFGYYDSPTNALYYMDNHDPVYSSVPPYSIGEPVFATQYDGMTVLLAAEVNIAANVTNHIKIAIADYNDETYDSAVLLEAWAPTPCP